VESEGTLVNVVFGWTVPVMFVQYGLNLTTAWTVEITAGNGSSPTEDWAAAGRSIAIPLANGTYRYSIVAPPGYSVSSPSGTLTVSGAPVTRNLQFAPSGSGGSLADWWWILAIAGGMAALGVGLVVARRRRTPPEPRTPSPSRSPPER
ncbi:MAG: hypothetical protein ACREBZ_06845, partial [Thermoplasmata archaeon]